MDSIAQRRHGRRADEESPLLARAAPGPAPADAHAGGLATSLKTHFGANVSKGWADLVLLFCYIITGLLDSSAVFIWGSFVSMQTGELPRASRASTGPYGTGPLTTMARQHGLSRARHRRALARHPLGQGTDIHCLLLHGLLLLRTLPPRLLAPQTLGPRRLVHSPVLADRTRRPRRHLRPR
jgi:hypothetical protein